ncbi:MAG: sigma-70 family RNA polymerase sigma factor [Lautropia sp.]|nr:sigma-70 family RNA polymerase sigma factor [Lautropia sp.]
MAVAGTTFDYETSLAACAAGDRKALRALYDREARWLMGVALRIVRDRPVAEEVLQDAFLQIWRSAATFDASRGSGRGWIYTVVRHRALQEVRKSGHNATLAVEDIDNLADHRQLADDAPDMDAGELERCLELLEPQKRECIIQAFVEGYTHEQIAKRLDAPLGTIKSWVRRGLVSLKECLS